MSSGCRPLEVDSWRLNYSWSDASDSASTPEENPYPCQPGIASDQSHSIQTTVGPMANGPPAQSGSWGLGYSWGDVSDDSVETDVQNRRVAVHIGHSGSEPPGGPTDADIQRPSGSEPGGEDEPSSSDTDNGMVPGTHIDTIWYERQSIVDCISLNSLFPSQLPSPGPEDARSEATSISDCGLLA